ncbi:989_t:CDS:2 [Diversispora eburnea]|uniref:989_t:CDS:1 n=1 Tax=Diversispora eburnea TaxID=1213867 RepID=A0A9N8W910_9GLOM|nr:989_t:CDS:2 [Diversispora eburnea]
MGKFKPVTAAEAIRTSSNNRDRDSTFKEAKLIATDNMLNQEGLRDQKIQDIIPMSLVIGWVSEIPVV